MSDPNRFLPKRKVDQIYINFASGCNFWVQADADHADCLTDALKAAEKAFNAVYRS